MVDWLNENQGFVMSVLTAVYVIATIVIIYYTRKSIDEMKVARDAESRPYVFAYLDKDPRDTCCYFRIKNYGKTGAIIENVTVTPNFKFAHKKKTEDFLNGVLLPPNKMLYFIVQDKKDEIMNTYQIEITYFSASDSKLKYCEKYELLFQYTRQMGYSNTERDDLDDTENSLKNIAGHLDSIRQKM